MVDAFKTIGSTWAALEEKIGTSTKISTAISGVEIGAATSHRKCQWNIL